MSAVSRNRWWHLVNWRVVVAAGIPVWVLIGGLVAWYKFTPRTAVAQTPPVVVVTAALEPPAAVPEVLPPPRVEVPVNPFHTPKTVVTVREVEIDPEVALAVGDAAKAVFRELFAARPAVVVAEADPVRRRVPAGFQTFDTAIHFRKSYDAAKKEAKAGDKLVFVLHLSGNIEDDGFT